MSEVLVLSRADVAALLNLDDCIGAVERAFAMLGRGKLPPPAIAGKKSITYQEALDEALW